MKINKLLLLSLAAAAVASCADDEFVTNSAVSGNGGMNGKLVETGLLGIGRGADADTRVYSPNGKFVWMPSDLEESGALTSDRLNQKVGLCWTGRNMENPDYSAVAEGALDQKVFTNYEYEHVGWLDNAAVSPKMDPCNASKLLNGAFIVEEGTPAALYEGTLYSTQVKRGNKYYYKNDGNKVLGSYTSTGDEESTGDLDLSRGVFKTNNAAVFEGEYLVYFPYTKAFTKGQILANLPQTFTVDVEKDAYSAASDSVFSIGYIRHYAGGSSASELKAKTLNGFLIAKLYNENLPNSVATNKTIKKVIFYTEDEGGIVYRQDLDASKCVEDLADGTLDKVNGELFYKGGTKVTTNALVANMMTGNDEGATVTAGTKEEEAVLVAIPVLPQSIKGLNVILIDDEDKSYSMPIEELGKITSNGVQNISINLNECEFQNEYLAVDELSFISAMAKIKDNGATTIDKDANKVKLLRDIRLTLDASDNPALNDYIGQGKYMGIYNSLFFDRNIQIYSNANAKLIVTAGTKMNIKNLSNSAIVTQNETDKTPTLTINVPVVVEGAGCCGEQVAMLSVGGMQNANHPCTVEMNGDVENHGTLALGNNAKGETVIDINATLTNKLDAYAENRGKTTDAAQVYILGGQASGNSEIKIKAIDNEGTVNSLATAIDIKEGTTDPVEIFAVADYSSANTRVVTSTVETLTNNGVVNVGDRTLMTVTSTLENATKEGSDATSLIKTFGAGASATDGRLDVKASTATNAGTIDNTGVINITGANLQNTGLFIDRTNAQVGGKYINNGSREETTEIAKQYAGNPDVVYTTDLPYKGIYVAQVETTARMSKVLKDGVIYPSTVIVEILNCEASGGVYNLSQYAKDLKGKDVRINTEADKQICFKAYKKNADGEDELEEKTFGHCVEVVSGILLLKDGLLSTDMDVKVLEGAKMNTAVTSMGKKGETTVTVGQDLIVNGEAVHNAKTLTVKRNLADNNTFTSNGQFAVGEKVTVSAGATFDSDGDANTAKTFETSGTTTFAYNTTTEIEGLFECLGGTFEREGLGERDEYRATVNVGSLGRLQGSTSTAWPTERPE